MSNSPEAELSKAAPSPQMSANQSPTIFISYPHEDYVIASKIEAAIKKLEGNRFDVFLDQSFILGGKEITSTIEESLDRTLYFVGVGTPAFRSNFAWCGQELGYFRAVRRRASPKPVEDITCLFHEDVPELFRQYKCFKIVALEDEQRSELGDKSSVVDAPVYEFLTDIANRHNKLFPAQNAADFFAAASAWATEWSKEITNAYFAALQGRVKEKWYPQARLELEIEDGNFWDASQPEIPASATVKVEAMTYSILGLGVPSGLPRVIKSWSEFVEIILLQTGSDTLTKMIRDLILSVLPSKADAHNDFVYQAPNGRYYRIILVMHQVYGNRKREFVINLIETLDPNYGGDERTTILIGGIVLATQYRSIFLEKDARYAADALRRLRGDQLVLAVRRLLRDNQKISAEASRKGLSDRTALIKLLGDTEEVGDLFQRWRRPFERMEQEARRFVDKPEAATREAFLTALDAFLANASEINERFISLCLRSYQDILDRQSSGSWPRAPTAATETVSRVALEVGRGE